MRKLYGWILCPFARADRPVPYHGYFFRALGEARGIVNAGVGSSNEEPFRRVTTIIRLLGPSISENGQQFSGKQGAEL